MERDPTINIICENELYSVDAMAKRDLSKVGVGKRDTASDIIWDTKLYCEICMGKRDSTPNIIHGIELYCKMCIGTRDSKLNIIWKIPIILRDLHWQKRQKVEYNSGI